MPLSGNRCHGDLRHRSDSKRGAYLFRRSHHFHGPADERPLDEAHLFSERNGPSDVFLQGLWISCGGKADPGLFPPGPGPGPLALRSGVHGSDCIGPGRVVQKRQLLYKAGSVIMVWGWASILSSRGSGIKCIGLYLDQKLEEMWKRLDGTYQVNNGD